ncbi:MAG: cytochrome c-type biogenesis protein CcmH [Nitrospirae bacterium]|nr:cytochrome c-type biogenesis protein CcmH [Candidatus Troglogloeales bacterium]
MRYRYFQICFFLLFFSSIVFAAPLTEEQVQSKVREISKTLRCAVCQSESVWESNAELASQMRAIVRERVIAGESGDEIRAYFISRYGDFIVLKPRVKGINQVIWFGPFLLLGVAGFLIYRKICVWVKQATPVTPSEIVPIDDAGQKRIAEALASYNTGEK